MLAVNLAVIGALSIVLGLGSRPFRELPLSEPLVALACGVLLGPQLVGLLELPPGHEVETLRVTAHLVLAISLMAVALRYPLEALRAVALPVGALVTLFLGGMAVISAGLGTLLLGLPVAEMLLLGAILAPTDPVLASSIVSGAPAERDLSQRLRVLLSTESGANDGLAFALVAVGTATATHLTLGGELRRSALEFGIGLAVGLVVGAGTGRLVRYADSHQDIEHSAFLVLTIALACFVLGAAEALGGQGLLAVFVAGLAYNHEISREERKEEWEVQEAVNAILVLPVFVLLGVGLPWAAWGDVAGPAVGFAVAVLLLRRLPLVLAAAKPLRLTWSEGAFLGWFGPIGIAALYYLSDGRAHGHVGDELWAAGTLVIALSTVAHGLTGTPGRRLLAGHLRH